MSLASACNTLLALRASCSQLDSHQPHSLENTSIAGLDGANRVGQTSFKRLSLASISYSSLGLPATISLSPHDRMACTCLQAEELGMVDLEQHKHW